MKKILLISILALIIGKSGFCQDTCKRYSFIEEYIKKSKAYERKARSLIKRDLVKENIYNSFTAKSLLENTECFIVPMFKLCWNESIDYSKEDDFFNSLEIHSKLLFHDVAIFKEDTFIGIYGCNEVGSCGFSLYKDTPNSFGILLVDLNNIRGTEHNLVFYVHGILHAWWVVKDYDIRVYSLLDRKFYKPQEFLDKFYTDDKIRKIIKYFH